MFITAKFPSSFKPVTFQVLGFAVLRFGQVGHSQYISRKFSWAERRCDLGNCQRVYAPLPRLLLVINNSLRTAFFLSRCNVIVRRAQCQDWLVANVLREEDLKRIKAAKKAAKRGKKFLTICLVRLGFPSASLFQDPYTFEIKITPGVDVSSIEEEAFCDNSLN